MWQWNGGASAESSRRRHRRIQELSYLSLVSPLTPGSLVPPPLPFCLDSWYLVHPAILIEQYSSHLPRPCRERLDCSECVIRGFPGRGLRTLINHQAARSVQVPQTSIAYIISSTIRSPLLSSQLSKLLRASQLHSPTSLACHPSRFDITPPPTPEEPPASVVRRYTMRVPLGEPLSTCTSRCALPYSTAAVAAHSRSRQ